MHGRLASGKFARIVLLLLTAAAISGAGNNGDAVPVPQGVQSRYSRRSLKQSSLYELVPEDDPFASAASVSGARFFPALFKHAARAVQQPQLSSHPIWPQRRSRAARGNATHSYRFSHTMQMELPQPWDTINMSHILRDNLEQDLVFWQQQEYVPFVRDLFHQARTDPQIIALPNTRRLVEIRDNVLRFPLMPEGPKQYLCDEECDPQLTDWVEGIRYGMNVLNLTIPNVLFMLNTDDSPMCNQEQVTKRECTVPVISLSKEVHMVDLIAPAMRKSDAAVIHRYKPWHEKKNKAYFRGVPSCGDMPFPPLCARTLVARLAQVSYPDILDAGLVEVYNRSEQIRGDPVLRDGNGSLPVLSREPMTVLPDYKYLLNLDGHVAAYRLSQLLATNSLVLKQHSNMVEYYYRSLKPFHHYVPIFKTSEHDFIPRLEWAMTHKNVVRHIISNANHFAMTYTTYKARIYYWVYVLMAYKNLFADQDEYFQPTAS